MNFYLFVFVFLQFSVIVSSNKIVCPFQYLYHAGDGVFDNGNSVRRPSGQGLPASKLPYGVTTPGYPTGRWSDGLLDIDIGATALGFPVLTPYLGGNATLNDAIIFAVAYSPVLDSEFFRTRGVTIPAFAASLGIQMDWFRAYLQNVCSTSTDCANMVGNSLFLFGDVEANDLTIPLLQGKSVQEVWTYADSVTLAQISAAREVIRLGGGRIILPGNVPIGCYPFMLTTFQTNNSKAYDNMGCLKTVNELIIYKNNNLQEAIAGLKREFPHVLIYYADFYRAFIQLLQETLAGPYKNTALQTCCGIGGTYGYNTERYCGSAGVQTCSNPSQFIHWDGIHLTEYANNRLSSILQVGSLEALNCTVRSLRLVDHSEASNVVFTRVKRWPKPNEAVQFYKAAPGAEEMKPNVEQEVPLVLSADLKLDHILSDFTDDSLMKYANGAEFSLEAEGVEATIAQSVSASSVREGEIADGEGACSGERVSNMKDPYDNVGCLRAV